MDINSGIDKINLEGQVALITGGGRGIGRATALALAGAGAKVAVTARSVDQLNETVALIQQSGGQAAAFSVDVTDQTAVEQTVNKIEQQLGPIDLLVNNAGIGGEAGNIWVVDADAWWRVLEVNLQGPFLCARAVLPQMVARQRGRIINVASGAGIRPIGGYSAYSVSKAALFRLSDCLTEMTSAYGISIFTISPGLVRTAMTQDLPIWQDLPDSEWTPAERAAELCVFLATGQADRLSGRYLHALNDIHDMLRRANEIEQNDLYTLRLRE